MSYPTKYGPCRIYHAYLIYLQYTEVWLLESRCIRSVGKTPSLGYPSNRKHVVNSTIEDFYGLLKSGALRVPVCDIGFASPDALTTVAALVEVGGEGFKASVVAVNDKDFDSVIDIIVRFEMISFDRRILRRTLY